MSTSAFDLSSVRHKLRHMVEQGLVTIEQLDQPSPGFRSNMNVSLHHFPCGYRGVRHQNLLRDQ